MHKEVEGSDFSSAMADAQEVATTPHIITSGSAAGQHIVTQAQQEEIQLHSTYTQTQPTISDDERIEEDREEETGTRVMYHSVAVQTQPDPEFDSPTYSVITGDGSVAYDSDGVRVLRAIGTWTPDYQSSEQYSDQSVEGYINGTESVVVRNTNAVNAVPSPSASSSNAVSNGVTTAPSTSRSVREVVTSQQVASNKPASGDKAFMCPVCNKGLARKDKLVIHMRIHTGEKPYVCEVCDRAFARRDKLVMHMNKLKHLTPSNIAPLGKRQHQPSTSSTPVVPEKRQDVKVEEPNSIEMGSPASSVDLQPAALVQVVHEQPTMTWNCELCGRICMSREEWTAHARSHLDGENTFGASSVSSSLSVLTPLSSYQYSGASAERQLCVVCRQEFPNKTDLILHLRGHFVGKPELLASHVASIVDPSGVCSQAV